MGEFDKKTVADVDVAGKKVLVRVDFNVPLDKATGAVADDRRIREALPTIRYLLDHGAAVILMSHLGRPEGKVVPKYSLCPVATRLGELLGRPVLMAPDAVGPKVQEMARQLNPGQVMLLENLRFHPGEEANDLTFARELASLGDLYVNDAFGTAHRAHASTVGITHYLPAVAGFLMEKELKTLGEALENPARPFVAIIGGAKISTKIAVLRNLLPKVDHLLVGGAMANTFLAAKGLSMGKSLVERDKLDVARDVMREAGDKLVLPIDVVVAPEPTPDAPTSVVSVNAVPVDQMALDVGPGTVAEFGRIATAAKTVVWNGPLGYYEIPKLAEGTRALAALLAKSPAKTIVGGGDLVAALEAAGLADKMSFVSTGGGASLELLEGKTLPGVAALKNK